MASGKSIDCRPADLESFGDRPAIIAVTSDSIEEMSYAELADAVGALSRGLIADGVEAGEFVGLFGPASPNWIVVCLALIGARAVPVAVDAQVDDEHLERMIEDAAIDRMFADEQGAARLEDVDFDGRVRRLDVDSDDTQSWQRLASGDGDDPGDPDADDFALLFYTSGTTGPPKGVPLRHRHLRFQVDAIEATGLVGESDRLLLPLPLHHVYPLVIGVLVPLSMGLPVILPHALTGPEFLRAVRETNATVIAGVPRLYSSLVDGLRAQLESLPWAARAGLKLLLRASTVLRVRFGLNAGRWLLAPLRRRFGASLRLFASGGSPLDPQLAGTLAGIGWDVAVGYGLTETAPLLTLNRPGSRRLESVGQPLDGVELRIDSDVDTAAENGSDETGEILARGPGIFDGYLNLDAESDESFTDGWFRTGDLGRIDDDGYLYVSGRRSTMIVTASGENLRTEALEEAYEKHPLIAEIGILKSGDRLAAVIFPDSAAIRRESTSVETAVGEAVRDRGRSMPSYQRIDRYRISEKPIERTRLGKIRRDRLAARYEALAAGKKRDRECPVDVGDMAKADRRRLDDDTVRKVWDMLCRRYSDRPLSPDSDFRLELDVDSMGWLDLSMDLAAKTSVELEEADIAQIATVRDLLDIVSDRPAGEGGLRQPLEQPERTLSAEQRQWLEPPSAAGRWFAALLRVANRWLMRIVFRVRRGDPGPLESGPAIFAPNHTSFLDPFVLAAALPPDILAATHWGGWTGYTLRNRLFRAASRALGVIPVEPERATMSSLAFAAAVLRRDKHLVWFPEGRRSRTGELVDLRPGIGAILEAVPDAQVIPVNIRGAFEAWPPDRRLPRPRRIEVEFGEPLSPGELADAGKGDSARERIVEALAGAMSELR